MYSLLLVIVLVWANSFVAIRHAVHYLTPIELAIVRFVPVAFIFATWLLITRRRALWAMIRADGLWLVALGLCGIVIYHVAINTGEKRVTAGTASLIIALNPAFVLILSALVLKEKPTWKKMLGLAVSFGGLFIVVRYASGQRVDFRYLGYVLITMISPLSWAAYSILGKPVTSRHSPLLVTGGASMAGSIPLLLFVRGDLLAKLPTLPVSVWLAVAFLSLLCTVFAFVAWFWVLQRIEVTRAAAFIYLQPLITVLFSRFLLDEPITVALVVGGAVIIIGVYLVNRR